MVSRAIGTEQTLPILQNVLISATKDRVTLSATNLELSIVTSFLVEIESEGSVTVPAKAILNFVQYNPDEQILVELKDGTQLKVSSSHSKAVIAGESASSYPVIAPVQKQIGFTVPIDVLLRALSLVTFACAKTTSRPVISGVYMRTEKGKLILVGTDSYRLSEYSFPLIDAPENVQCIIPARFLEEVRGVVSGRRASEDGKDEKDVHIHLSNQQIEVIVGSTELVSRLIDGKFPDYVQVLPKERKTTVFFTAKEMLTTVKRMHYFAKEMNNNITFTIKGDSMSLTTRQTQIGKDEATVTARVEGEENKIALSSHYLSDFLARIDTPDLQMELSDKAHPAMYRIPGDESYFHLIMPLRMTEE